MTYDAIVTTNDGKYTYQNIEALNEQQALLVALFDCISKFILLFNAKELKL